MKRITHSETGSRFPESVGEAVAGTLLFLLLAAGTVAGQRSTVEDARETIGEWIQTQRVLSDEKSRWRQEKEILDQSIALLEKESELLTTRLNELKKARDETADERRDLSEKEEALGEASAEADKLIASLQAEILELQPVFPPALERRTEPLLSRLDSASSPDLARRLQAVLGILGEIDRFQRNVTLSRESRDLEDGTRREVHTIYLGLAHAFFVDDNGRVAGMGRPAGEGWEWKRDDDLAASVSRAVAVLQNERPAEFIDLPVEIER